MELKQHWNENSISVNEVFGPTIQGEGVDVGKSCFFLRLHHCPVKCPGCDTSYTWNGTEDPTRMKFSDLMKQFASLHQLAPGAGVVVSGGEPLLLYRNENWYNFMSWVRQAFPWCSLETSGFVSPKPIDGTELATFLWRFTTVHLSPKITPCLHGEGWTDEELLVNVPSFMRCFADKPSKLIFKFVVRDDIDVAAVEQVVERFRVRAAGFPVYLMPYGLERDEIIESCIRLAPHLARTGFILSPRLHSILWGKQRGV